MILVIEDDAMINNLLCKVLSDNGFETDSALDGEAGLEKALDNFYDLIITSDHGNVEKMKNDDGSVNVGHTDNLVPFIVCDEKIKLKPNGSLKDVIPTVIDIYEISKPKDMTGESLIVK